MQESIVVKKEVRDGFTGAVVTDIELYYSNKNYSKMMEKFRVIAANLIAIFLIAILLILTLIKHFLRPLNNIASKISSYKPGSNVEFDIPDSKCETGVIVTAFKMMQENINDYANKLEDINQNLETEVASKTAELVELNNDLKKRVEEEIEKRVEKDKLLIQQSRLAIMGEMISMIAHQWRQPLNTLAIMIQDTAFKHSTSQLSKEDMEQFTNDCMKTIQKMSKTVDDFRSFFRPNNPREEFSIEGAIRDTLSVAEAMFASDNIAIVFDSTSEHHITGYKNELEQVILILLTNAKDALVENNISNPHIQITVENIENDTVEIVVRDNGSGIPLDIMDKIFDPYFSTKNKNSSGIGLYMSKEIIERQMKGSISVKNNKDGAEFSIAIK